MSSAPSHRTPEVPAGPRVRRIPADQPPAIPVPVARAAAPPPLPRTSTARPWDRVRFTGEALTGAERYEERLTEEAPGTDQPDPERLAAGIARHAVEALLGTRSAAQLSRWLAPALYESLTRRVALANRLQGAAGRRTHVVVRAVSGCSPAAGVREMSVVLHDGTKIRAAAVRLERFRSRWRAVALEIG